MFGKRAAAPADCAPKMREAEDQAVLTAFYGNRRGALDQSRARLLSPKITSVCQTQTRRLRPVEGIQAKKASPSLPSQT